ncbi:MAG: amphi-Trp domain-containing protein [Desulfovermiculus sp.]
MGEETKLLKSEEQKTRPEVSAFLHQLADKVGEGRASLSQGREKVVLEIPQNLILELQVEDEIKGTKGIQHSLKVEIKWFDQEDQDAAGTLQLK